MFLKIQYIDNAFRNKSIFNEVLISYIAVLKMRILNEKHNRDFVKAGRNLRKRLVFFGQNSGLHGLNHLFGENVYFLAR